MNTSSLKLLYTMIEASLYTTIHDLRDVLPHIDKQTLLVLDIEGLLINEKGYLGPTQTTLARPEAKEAFTSFHKKTDFLIGLTARIHRASQDTTTYVLNTILGRTFSGWQNISFPYGYNMGFFESCIFAGGASKGEYLYRFLEEDVIEETLLEKEVHQLVFVDDRASNCQDVGLVLQKNLKKLPIKEFKIFYCPPPSN